MSARWLIKRFLELLLFFLTGAFLFVLLTDYRLYLHDRWYFTFTGLAEIYWGFMLVLALRLWLAPPPGTRPAERLDWLIDGLAARVRRLAEGKTGRPRAWPAAIYRLIGLDFTQTGPVWRFERTSFMLAVLLTAFLFAAPAFRYFAGGILPDIDIHVESMNSGLKGEPFKNHFHYLMMVPIEEVAANPTGTLSKFASHFRPILYLFLPFYRLFPSALILFLLQALITGSAAWAFSRLARQRLQRDEPALLALLCFCLYPSVVSTSWSFFPCVLGLSFLTWSFYLSERDQKTLTLLCLALTLASKEIMALPVLSFGVYLFFWKKQRLMGAGVVAAALAWLIACLYWIIPYFSPDSIYPYVKIFYTNLGQSIPEILWNSLTRPCLLAPIIFRWSTLEYLLGLLLPLAFLPLAAWPVWGLNLPVLAQNLLAGPVVFWARWPAGHLSATIAPFTFMALLTGLARIEKRYAAPGVRRALCVCLFTSLAMLPAAHVGDWSDPTIRKAVAAVKDVVQPGQTVSTNLSQLWSRIGRRAQVTPFPLTIDQADWLVVEYDTSLFPPDCRTEAPSLDSVKSREIRDRAGVKDPYHLLALWQACKMPDDKRFAKVFEIQFPYNILKPDSRQFIAIYQRVGEKNPSIPPEEKKISEPGEKQPESRSDRKIKF